jgi:hypothetical protein
MRLSPDKDEAERVGIRQAAGENRLIETLTMKMSPYSSFR